MAEAASASREATATIRGYLYQFHAAVRALVALPDDATLTIEGLEDFDVTKADETLSAQVKYYAAQKLTDSVLRDAIEPMLRGFLADGDRDRKRYVLYGHFREQPETFEKVTNETLKRVLTRGSYLTDATGKRTLVQHNLQASLGASDDDLIDFADRLSVELAEEFGVHRAAVISELAAACGTSSATAEKFCFPTAVTLVSEMAANPDASARVISREVFLAKLEPDRALYNEWDVLEASEADYCRRIRREHFSQLNVERAERFFLLSLPQTDDEEEVEELVYRIIDNWSTHKSRGKPNAERFAPFIYIPTLSPEALARLKGRLFGHQVITVDGYPFKDAEFNLAHLKTPQTLQYPIAARFLGSVAELDAAIASISSRTITVQLYYKDPVSFTGTGTQLVIPIKNARMARRIV